MVDLNKVYLGGNLTRDPELRYTPSNAAVTNMGMAINRNYMDRNGQKVDETTFVDVVVWGKQAENVCKYLKKGSPALVEGALQFESWEQDGQKRSRIRVRAARVQFLGGSARDNQGAGQANYNANSGATQSFASQPSMNAPASEPMVDEFPDNDIPF